MAMIDSQRNIRSTAFGLGPMVVLPPANFPLASGAVTGGDFASAIAGGNPVIAKSHRGHPAVSRLAAGEVVEALRETGLPAATVQLVHGVADGERLVADPRVGGTGFTGSESAGRKLFTAASAAGQLGARFFHGRIVFLFGDAVDALGAQHIHAECLLEVP